MCPNYPLQLVNFNSTLLFFYDANFLAPTANADGKSLLFERKKIHNFLAINNLPSSREKRPILMNFWHNFPLIFSDKVQQKTANSPCNCANDCRVVELQLRKPATSKGEREKISKFLFRRWNFHEDGSKKTLRLSEQRGTTIRRRRKIFVFPNLISFLRRRRRGEDEQQLNLIKYASRETIFRGLISLKKFNLIKTRIIFILLFPPKNSRVYVCTASCDILIFIFRNLITLAVSYLS